jgi:hypothetical protein
MMEINRRSRWADSLARERNALRSEREGWRPLRRDELRDELVRDTYKSNREENLLRVRVAPMNRRGPSRPPAA